MNKALEVIKKAAMDAVINSAPADIVYGTVLSVSPLSVYVDQKKTLEAEFLVLTRNVTDFDTEVTVQWRTENTSGGGGGYDAFSSHSHAITGRKPIRVHNALKAGERVAMIQMSGGQEYLIIDRVVAV